MRDYAELVTRLRKRGVNLKEKFSRNAELLSELMQAADAIEELLGQHEADAKEIEWLKKCVQDLPKPPRWISVEERLPEKSKIALVAYDNGVVAKGKLFFGKFRGANFGFDENDEPIIAEVTHWMPLPAPPKGVE